MATWPTGLPQKPLNQGFGAGIDSGRVSSQPEHGPRQYRRRFTATEDPYSVRYRMTFSQWETLKTFYKITTYNGSIEFDWPDPITGNTISVTFEEPPSISSVVTDQHVDVDVRVREQPS